MPNLISPIGNDQFFDSNGNLLVGGKLFTYLAGTSTKTTVYANILGTAAHTNPIILNAFGLPPAPIYITRGVAYKFVLAPATDTDPPSSPIYTWDDISEPAETPLNQWVNEDTPTFVAVNQFSVPTDRTSVYHVGRRVQMISNIGTFYAWITAVAFTTVTTVTVLLDSGVLDASLHTVSYSFLPRVGSGIPDMRHDLLDTYLAGLLTQKMATPHHRFIGTEGSAKDYRIVESAGLFLLQRNDGTEAVPVWVTAFNLTGLNFGQPINTGAGSISAHEGAVTISANQNLQGVHYYTDFTLNASVVLTVNAAGLVIIATGTITINGTINANLGPVGGAGGNSGGDAIPGGTGGTGSPGRTAPGSGGGGGGGGGGAGGTDAGPGGQGGPVVFLTDTFVGGTGGAAGAGGGGGAGGTGGVGNTGSGMTLEYRSKSLGVDLDDLCGAGGGGGGQGGQHDNPDTGGLGGAGGRGGGAILLIAPTVVVGSGAIINANGGVGSNGAGGSDVNSGTGGGGGGGGGGTLVIHCRSFTNSGTLSASGGAGGTSPASGGLGGRGGSGGVGPVGTAQILIYP